MAKMSKKKKILSILLIISIGSVLLYFCAAFAVRPLYATKPVNKEINGMRVAFQYEGNDYIRLFDHDEHYYPSETLGLSENLGIIYEDGRPLLGLLMSDYLYGSPESEEQLFLRDSFFHRYCR